MEKKKTKKPSPRQRALNTVKNNIEKIYIDTNVEEQTLKTRRDYNINDGLYNNCKKDVAEMKSIHKLIKVLTEKWTEQCHKDERVMEIINARVVEHNIRLEVSNVNEAEEIIKDMKTAKITSRNYLKDVIENYKKGASLFLQRMNVSPEIWHSVLVAKLFTIPEEKVLECKVSILEEDYLPSINDFLLIKINELTTQDDLSLIWKKDVKKIQDKYKKEHGYINAEREYPNRKINEIIMKFHNQGLTHKGICNQPQVKSKIKNCTPAKIAERIKAHRKYTRQNKNFKKVDKIKKSL